jgi:predicted porin
MSNDIDTAVSATAHSAASWFTRMGWADMRGIKESLLSAASLAVMVLGCSGAAYAADLSSMPVKAPPVAPGPTTCTSIQDFFTTACQLAWYGVRFYGAVDVGGGYETNGAPFAKFTAPGVNYFPGKMNFGAKWLPSPNALSVSNIGIQIKEPIGGGWSFVGQLEAGFNPYSFQLANGVHSVYAERGVPLGLQNAYGDSNSQGLFYNDLGFAGISNDIYGTLTFGRQNTLMADAILAYDPMASSLAFSVLGFFGAWGGGGDTEDRKGTTAIKYRVNIANFHLGAFGQVGGYEEGNAQKGAVQGDVGADFRVGPGVLSADAIAGHTKDAVSITIVGPTNAFGNPTNIFTPGFANAFMNATLSDNTNVMLDAKYTMDRLKLYAGWEWIDFTNPSNPFTIPGTGFNDIAGDFVCFDCVASGGTQISSTAFNGGDKILQLAWFGATFAITDSLDLTGAYYHEWQNNYSGGAANAAKGTCALATTALSSCQGTLDAASVLLDWRFAPKWDTYIGTMYNRLSGGLDNGYLSKDSLSTVGGLRFRW